jgi:predicted ArsR family transcriptional regulator
MPTPPRQATSLSGTRERILNLLRRSSLTANELAARLGLTHTAVRVHVLALKHGGLVRDGGSRPSASKPAVVYELVPRADVIFSEIHIPFVAHLLRVLGERTSRARLDDLMRTVGRSLASEWPHPDGDLQERVEAASALLNDLGALTEVEPHGMGFVVRGSGCLLAEAVHARPEVCRAMESLVAALVQTPVRGCCERSEHPRCCFEIPSGVGATNTRRAGTVRRRQ